MLGIRPLVCVISCAVLWTVCDASHFEGGTITFKRGWKGRTTFEWRQGWILGTGPCGSGCSGANIGSLGSTSVGNWTCQQGCGSNITVGLVQYTVTGVDTTENYEQGSAAFVYTFSGSGPFTVGYTGCCWRALNHGFGSNWNIRVTFNLGKRSDNRRYNNPPSTTSAPIYRFQYACGISILTIPMTDSDGDDVRCRWATGNECMSICNALPASTIANTNGDCVLSLDTNHVSYTANGWYAVALTIEDFGKRTITMGGLSYTTTTALSSVPNQFMIYTPSQSTACAAVPLWVTPTPLASATFSVIAGGSISIPLHAEIVGATVTSITVTGPAGGTLMPSTGVLADTQGRPDVRMLTWSWTPSPSQTSGYNLCFQATDSNWKVSEFRCVTVAVAVQCPDPGFVTSSARTPSVAQLFNFATSVTFVCTTGTEASSGDLVRACQLSGSFNGTNPNCTIISCGTPTMGANVIKTGTVYTYRAVATFACATGYVFVSGSTSRTCQATKAWDGSSYTCARINCGDPGTPSNGARTGTDFQYTGILTFSCNIGYYMASGSTSRTCQSTGVWSNTQPACARISCPVLTAPQNGTMTGTNHWYLDVATFGCDVGYEPNTGVTSVSCLATQAWSGAPLTCKRITCPTLTQPQNGTKTGVLYRYLYNVGFACVTGYERNAGDSNLQCLSNRIWNGTQLTCKRITCPSLTQPQNGTKTGTAFRYLDHVSFACDTGYEKDTGNFNMQCQSTRAWNGTQLTCKRITCPTLTAPQNGTKTGSAFRYLDHVGFACDTGYERAAGDLDVQCQANRLWNGTQLTCKRITCPTLTAPQNGTKTGTGYRYLDNVDFACDTGYERKAGDFNLQCQAIKSWNGTQLTCKRVQCLNMTNPPNVYVKNSFYGANINTRNHGFFYLDKITWDCNSGFVVKGGNWTQECLANREWSGTKLVCKDVDECASDPCITGLCKNLPGRYACSCVNGFSGARCEIPPTMNPNMFQGLTGGGSTGNTGVSNSNPFNLHVNQYQANGAERSVAAVWPLLVLLLCGAVLRW